MLKLTSLLSQRAKHAIDMVLPAASRGTIMDVLNRIVTGDGMRKSRFHNYAGQFIDPGGFCFLPHAVYSTLWRKLLGYRPKMPWLGYRAVRRLASLINDDWNVLEFGSGMSTLWLAGRCKRLVSIEHDESWYNTLRTQLARRRIGNVDYRMHSREEYHLLPDYTASAFDLVIVDGLAREKAAQTALVKVKPQGYIYLDNSDVPYADYENAKTCLLEAAWPFGRAEYFNDFCPTQVSVNQGLLVQIGKSAGRVGVTDRCITSRPRRKSSLKASTSAASD